MPKFGEVFSTTLKVLGALFLISLGIGLIYFVIHGIGTSLSNEPATSDTFKHKPDQYEKRADDKHTSMPLSQWNKLVAAGIKQHCAFEGMTKEDAEQALGKPAEVSRHSDGSEAWTYSMVDHSKCLRYEGDNCAEYEKRDNMLFFTAAGHMEVGDTGDGCYKEPFFSMHMKAERR